MCLGSGPHRSRPCVVCRASLFTPDIADIHRQPPSFYHAYALAPHYTRLTFLTLVALACIWALEDQTVLRSILLALGALFCVLWIMLPSSLIVLLMPILLFFSVASLFSARRWQLDIPRRVTGVVILVALAALGVVGYVYGL
jgi:hypothetical protein